MSVVELLQFFGDHHRCIPNCYLSAGIYELRQWTKVIRTVCCQGGRWPDISQGCCGNIVSPYNWVSHIPTNGGYNMLSYSSLETWGTRILRSRLEYLMVSSTYMYFRECLIVERFYRAAVVLIVNHTAAVADRTFNSRLCYVNILTVVIDTML